MADWLTTDVAGLPVITAVLLAALCAVTDGARSVIPNRITYPALAVALLYAALAGGSFGLLSSFAGAVAGATPLLVLFLVSRSSTGGGDVKLMAALGALLGAAYVTEALLIACAAFLLLVGGELAWRGRRGFTECVRGRRSFGLPILVGTLGTSWDVRPDLWQFAAQHPLDLLAPLLIVSATGALTWLAWRRVTRRASAAPAASDVEGAGPLGRLRLALPRIAPRAQRGAVAVEFTIAIVPFLLLLMAITQIGLASMCRLMVDYAAFCAARAAVVLVPASGVGSDCRPGGGEGPNQIGTGQNRESDYVGSNKAACIRDAAAYALTPASPSIDSLIGSRVSVATTLDAGVIAPGGGPLSALGRAVLKLPYARAATIVRLVDAKGHPRSSFAWNEPITARVTFLFPCRVPLAGRLMGRSLLSVSSETLSRLSPAGLALVGGAALQGRFLEITAEHTLTNQGRP